MSWNSAAHLPAAVTSVPPGVPVVVVDNASTDGSAAVARAAGARVIDAGANLGFGPACNLAAREGGPSETILFLNPDAALVDGASSLAALLAALDADPAVVAAAPRLTGDGQEEFQLRRLPRLGGILREALLVDRLFPSNGGFRRDRYLDRARDAAFDVEQPAAAALLVRRAAFEARWRLRSGVHAGVVRGRGPLRAAPRARGTDPLRPGGARDARRAASRWTRSPGATSGPST